MSIMNKLSKQKGNAETVRTLLQITQNLAQQAQHMEPSDLEALNKIRKNNEMSSLVFSSPKSLKKSPEKWGGIDLMSSPALEHEKKEMLKAACAQLEKEKEGAEADTGTMKPKQLFAEAEEDSAEDSASVNITPAIPVAAPAQVGAAPTIAAPVVAAPVVAAPVVAAPVVAAPVGVAPVGVAPRWSACSASSASYAPSAYFGRCSSYCCVFECFASCCRCSRRSDTG